jgi:choline-sulfatase
VFSEFYGNYSTAPAAMLRRGRYKLNANHGERCELFDVEDDPGELNDVAADRPGVRRRLEEELLENWNPEEIDRRVRASQARRRYIGPYLFGYLEDGRTKPTKEERA